MYKKLIALLAVWLLSLPGLAGVAAAPVSADGNTVIWKQGLPAGPPWTAGSFIEVNNGDFYCAIGRQNYSPSQGLIAELWGIYGVKTRYAAGGENITLFFGHDGQDLFAANAAANLAENRGLRLEATYFRADSQFFGLTATSRLAKSLTISLEAAQNLTSLARGYLVSTKLGHADRPGEADFTVSYRNIGAGALSDYSANSAFDDSKGLRLAADVRLTDSLTLTAFQDFAKSQDNVVKNQNNLTLAWLF